MPSSQLTVQRRVEGMLSEFVEVRSTDEARWAQT